MAENRMVEDRFVGMYDIHCHMIPEVDDGAESMEMSLAMVEASYNQGVRNIIATPHYYPGHRNASKERLEGSFAKLKQLAEEKYPGLTMYLGNEIYYRDEVKNLLKDKEVRSLAGSRYVLAEFPYPVEYSKIEDAVNQLTGNGYYPILAHVERYHCLHNKMDKIEELIERGAYIQVNSENFRSGLIVNNRKYVLQLMQNGLVHFIGSDSHNLEDRKPNLDVAVNYLSHKGYADDLYRILIENPKKIIENQCI